MAIEIERKYLVKNDCYKSISTQCLEIKQGYLCRDIERTVRVRTIGENGFITIKGKNKGISRHEFEYEIPCTDAEQLLRMCGKIIEKKRYIVFYKGMRWEIDEFSGSLSPLVLAEVELPCAEHVFDIPSFIGKDVSDDPRYFNSNLLESLI